MRETDVAFKKNSRPFTGSILLLAMLRKSMAKLVPRPMVKPMKWRTSIMSLMVVEFSST
jgi:hypothetical protein